MFLSTGSRTNKDTRTKKLCARCFDSHQNSLHKVCPKPIADTSSRSHRTLHATCFPCHCQGRGPPQASTFSRPGGGIINKARGMGSSALGATDCPRSSQQRVGAAPGAPHQPIIYAPAHTADKASHRIPDGPTRFRPSLAGAWTHKKRAPGAIGRVGVSSGCTPPLVNPAFK